VAVVRLLVAIKWLLLGWVTVCGQVNHLEFVKVIIRNIVSFFTSNKIKMAFTMTS